MDNVTQNSVFEIETLQDWQLNAGQENEIEPGGSGCNTGNSTNNDAD